MTVLDIRGTHGSGKSWIVKQLLASHGGRPLMGSLNGKSVVLGCELPGLEAVAIGPYDDRNTCGCDRVIQGPTEVVRRVRLFCNQYRYVLLEGVLVAHTFQRYRLLAEEVADYRFLFLNTPLTKCITRVMNRRRERGVPPRFSTKNLRSNHATIHYRVREKLLAVGATVVDLPWRDPMPTVLQQFEATP